MENIAKYRKPPITEMQGMLSKMKGWLIDKNRLVKEYQFPDYARAMVFVNKIVNPIEENQNYPRILISYNRVFISLFNNDAGAITVMDFEMAEEFDRLAGKNAEPPKA